MKFKRIVLVSFLVCVLALMSACASTPSNKFIKNSPNFQQIIANTEELGIISDICLTKDTVGKGDYIDIENSRLAETYMLEGSTSYLESKGYKIVCKISPFIGAFKNSQDTCIVKGESGEKENDKIPPFFVCEDIERDEPYKKALTIVIKEIAQLFSENELPQTERFASDEMKESLSIISSRTKAKILFVVLGDGRMVSGSKKFAKGLTTAVATTALTAGYVTVAKWDVSFIDSYVGVLDLEKGEIIWTNSGKMQDVNLTKQDFYQSKWPESFLYHFPEKEIKN